MVPTIKVKGFGCSVDEAVFGTGREGYAQLLSLVGSREAVKAVWARLMKGEAAYLYTGSETRAVRMNTSDGAKLLTERLPSGAFHGLLLSKSLLRGELVVCEREQDLPTRFFHLLSQQLQLPLHDVWKDWLWAYALSAGALHKLSSQRLYAYKMSLKLDAFEKAVRLALLAGELPEVELPRAA